MTATASANMDSKVTAAGPKPVTKFSSWFQDDLVTTFKAGISHVFLVHGDINGLVVNQDRAREKDQPYISVRRFFEKAFSKRRMVIFYNIASGIRFLRPQMEGLFREIAGIDTGPPKDPVSAAKADLAAKRGIPREPDAVLPFIEKVLKAEFKDKATRVAVVINSVHFLAPAMSGGFSVLPTDRANIERLKNWAEEEEIREKGHIVVLLTDDVSKVSMELRQAGSGIHQIFIPKPGKEERRDYIQSFIEGSKYYQDLIAKGEKFDADELSLATQGMSLRQILEIFLHSQQTGKALDLAYIKTKKKEILNQEYGDVMEIVEPEHGLEDIGGLEYVKSFFREELEAIKTGESRLVAMGITLMGPPGTGKTAIVEALAKEAGFNFVKTKSIRSMWVGESEGRMQKLIYGLRALAPVVVMNDEADLMDANRDAPKGDSGVSERLMKMWMELLSDPRIRGQIIVISCTNRPDRIDPALKRSGRSDERILMPMPSAKEIADIFRVVFRFNKITTNIADFSPYAELASGLSGADVVNISLKAFRFAFAKGKAFVDDAILIEAIDDTIPSASQAEIDRMTLFGILESSSRRLLPPNIKEIISAIRKRNLVENLEGMLDQIRARNIVNIDEP